jgi:muconolactone delta-isomerase
MKKHYLVFFSLALIFGFVIGSTVNGYTQEVKAKEKMKFLVIAEPKDIYYSMSANERKQIMDANNTYLKKQAKAGKILEFYNIPGWNRAVSIEEYESIEEFYNHCEGSPMYPYVKFEVYPLKKIDLQTGEADKVKSKAKMKFLVINEAKPIWYAMPAGERKKIEEANNEYGSKETKDGAFLSLYSIPGWNRAASIEQYDSIESLYKHFEGDPYYPYGKFEVYPLIEVDMTK